LFIGVNAETIIMTKNKQVFLKLAVFLFFPIICFAQSNLVEPEVKFNPWELIIYRSENYGEMNDIRCWVKLTDEDGNDVTYTKVSATYEWVTIPDRINRYKKSFYLMGGMAMHLQLKSGKYKITVYSPLSETECYGYDKEFLSNEFDYDTNNPIKVIFVSPIANENGFYNGSWYIDYKSPTFYKYTKPKTAF